MSKFALEQNNYILYIIAYLLIIELMDKYIANNKMENITEKQRNVMALMIKECTQNVRISAKTLREQLLSICRGIPPQYLCGIVVEADVKWYRALLEADKLASESPVGASILSSRDRLVQGFNAILTGDAEALLKMGVVYEKLQDALNAAPPTPQGTTTETSVATTGKGAAKGKTSSVEGFLMEPSSDSVGPESSKYVSKLESLAGKLMPKQLMGDDVFVMDTETSGIRIQDTILDICFIHLKTGSCFHAKFIPPWACQVGATAIEKNADVSKSVPTPEGLSQLIDFIRQCSPRSSTTIGIRIYAHNGPKFDKRMLEMDIQRSDATLADGQETLQSRWNLLNTSWIDTISLIKSSVGSRSMDKLRERYGVSAEEAHTALGDTVDLINILSLALSKGEIES